MSNEIEEGLPEWSDKENSLSMPSPSPPAMPEDMNIEQYTDVLAHVEALKNEGTRQTVVAAKGEEILAGAETKAAAATAGLYKAEAEKIEAHALKAEAFFKANMQILGVIGIRHALGYRTMTALFPVALTLYLLVALTVYFPFSIAKYIISFFIDIAGDMAKKITTNGLKIFLAVSSVLLTAGLIGAVYYIITAFIL